MYRKNANIERRQLATRTEDNRAGACAQQNWFLRFAFKLSASYWRWDTMAAQEGLWRYDDECSFWGPSRLNEG